jgi:hypothetical protein
MAVVAAARAHLVHIGAEVVKVVLLVVAGVLSL